MVKIFIWCSRTSITGKIIVGQIRPGTSGQNWLEVPVSRDQTGPRGQYIRTKLARSQARTSGQYIKTKLA